MKITAVAVGDLDLDIFNVWEQLRLSDTFVDSPFLSSDFTRLASTVLGGIEVGLMEEGGEIVGFFPFRREKGNVARPVAWQLSDMNGVVVKKTVKWTVEQLMRDCGLETWHFDHLIASLEQFQPYHAFVEDSPYIDLSRGFAVYEAEKCRAGSSALRQAARKSRKVTRELGELRFVLHTLNDHVFDSMMAWKSAQLVRKHYVNPLKMPWTRDFLNLLRHADSPTLSGVMSALYAGDRLVAAHLGLRSGDVLASLVPAYDVDFARHSPGLLLHRLLIEQAAQSGIKRIDLGRGENQLKAGLQSGAESVAIGTVELRLWRRLRNTMWYELRQVVHGSSLRGKPLVTYRRIKNWLMHR